MKNQTYTHELAITTHYVLCPDNAFNKDIMHNKDEELINRFITLSFPISNDKHFLNLLFDVRVKSVKEYTDFYNNQVVNPISFSKFIFQNSRSVFNGLTDEPHLIYEVKLSAKMYSEFNIDKNNSTNWDRRILDTFYYGIFNPNATRCEVLNVFDNDQNFIAVQNLVFPFF